MRTPSPRRGTAGFPAVLGLLVLLVPDPGPAQNLDDARLLAEPGVSPDRIAFEYDGDLWVASRDGTAARRITTHDGTETSPRFSPDGEWLAFTGEYDGNADVYIVPVDGGVPTRLTWHPGADQVRDWTPDGSGVLFLSQRAVHTNRHARLYIAPVDGGMPEPLPIPSAYAATFSPDGSRIAYTPLAEAMAQWKGYRGGRTSRIWLFDRDDHEVTEIPQPASRSNDTDPVWIDGTVYFRSDRNGEFNLFAYDVVAGTVEQLTDHRDFPILAMDGDRSGIVYEQAGWLHSYDPGSGRTSRLQVALTSDFNETRPRYVSDDRFIRGHHVSPSGARAVFEFRGDIVTVPAEKGDVRLLTETSDAHDRSPAWSPDGTRVAWFSDASGEYELVIGAQDGRGEPRRLPIDGAGFYEDLKWAPDGSMVSFTDNSWTLYIMDVETGELTAVAQEPIYGPFKTLHHAWAPDSRASRPGTKCWPRFWFRSWSCSVSASRPGASDTGIGAGSTSVAAAIAWSATGRS